MAKAKQGDIFSCTECGLVVMVDEACGCAAAEIVCCEMRMAKGKLAADKARKKAPVKAIPSGAKAGKMVNASPTKKGGAKTKAAAKKASAKVVTPAKKAAPAKKAPAAKKK
jgi:hypothetical protein